MATPEPRIRVSIRCAFSMSAFFFYYWFQSIAGVLAIASIWILCDRCFWVFRRREVRFICKAYLVLAILVAVPHSGFANYRLSHGYKYKGIEESVRTDIRVEFFSSATELNTHDLLPGLQYCYFEGPYGVEVRLLTNLKTIERVRIVNAQIRSLDGANGVVLKMDREVFQYLNAKINPGGWGQFKEYTLGHDGYQTFDCS